MKRRWNLHPVRFHAFGVGTVRSGCPRGIPESMAPDNIRRIAANKVTAFS
jgi:hypothetical protein